MPRPQDTPTPCCRYGSAELRDAGRIALVATTSRRVNHAPEDDGPGITGLWVAAWVLGPVALGSLIRLLTYAADGVEVQVELFVWLLVGAKSIERRMASRIREPSP